MKKILGWKIQEFRKRKKLSLTELSDLSGVQLATLSRIEHGLMVGTIEAHAKIASALGIDLPELYKEMLVNTEKPEIRIKTDDPDVTVTNKSSTQELLTKNLNSKKLLPLLITIQPDGETKKERMDINKEHFVYVLKGTLEVVRDEQSYKVTENESIYFTSSSPYFFKNPGKTVTKLIYVNTK